MVPGGGAGGGQRAPFQRYKGSFNFKRAPLLVAASAAAFALALRSDSRSQAAVASAEASGSAAGRLVAVVTALTPCRCLPFASPPLRSRRASPPPQFHVSSLPRWMDRIPSREKKKQNNQQQQRVLPAGRTRLPTPVPAKARFAPTLSANLASAKARCSFTH